ncbi:hypothetical protein KFK09_014640 [Dendrobium nobile]|uniref:Uncharacterized protein n=1 Tax=Dendrobium nobile TaxID=94219 RepID=A0A8T3B3P4_DENNO|nr:hypothetical protein KFK09_014640 [Dendrobium nobile]
MQYIYFTLHLFYTAFLFQAIKQPLTLFCVNIKDALLFNFDGLLFFSLHYNWKQLLWFQMRDYSGTLFFQQIKGVKREIRLGVCSPMRSKVFIETLEWKLILLLFLSFLCVKDLIPWIAENEGFFYENLSLCRNQF